MEFMVALTTFGCETIARAHFIRKPGSVFLIYIGVPQDLRPDKAEIIGDKPPISRANDGHLSIGRWIQRSEAIVPKRPRRPLRYSPDYPLNR